MSDMSETNDMGYSTDSGIKMKGGKILTGMDKLVNPKAYEPIDQIFDSSPSRDINTGSVMDQGGIQYKGIKMEGALGLK